jgi:hypothetical protein
MGERVQPTLFQPKFNRSVRVEASDVGLSEDTGALVLREAAGRLGVDRALKRLVDARDQARLTHPLVELAMTRVVLYGQGLRYQDDADTHRHDDALRLAVSTRGGDRAVRPRRHALEPEGLASQPTLSRMNTMLATPENLSVLREVLLEAGCRRIEICYPNAEELTLDVDSFAQAAHGHQEGAVYNGHYHMTCMHPLHAVTDTGDLVGIELRSGNVHTADNVQPFLQPIIERLQKLTTHLWVRIDAGFASGELFDWLEERKVHWVTRLKTNARLAKHARSWRERTSALWSRTRNPNLRRQSTLDFWYKAGKWSRGRRVVAVLVERQNDEGELFDDVFFLATNVLPMDVKARDLLERYRRRGIAEQRIGEFKSDISPTLSSPTLAENQVTCLLAALGYELMHHIRERIAARHPAEPMMSIRTVRARLLKVASVVVHHARRIVFRISAVKQKGWRRMSHALADRRTEGVATA